MEKKNSSKASNEVQQKNSIVTKQINDLNDYCLTHILQYLSIVERIKLERVCKRWRRVLKDSWYDLKMLSFDNNVWGFKNPSDLSNLNTRNLKKVLSRCGQYVAEVELLDHQKKLGLTALGTIATLCPNISHVFAPKVKFRPESISTMTEKCSNIVDLTLGDSTMECDNVLAMLFKKNQKLKHFYICSNSKVTGECLLGLNPDCIESINFENCPRIMLRHFIVLKSFKHLKSLSLEHFHDIDERAATGIGECFKNLQELKLTLCSFFPSPVNKIEQLRNLKTLDLSSNDWIDNSALVTIGDYCKSLSSVNISACESVSNRGLAGILNLPELECLFAEELDVSDEVFDRVLPNLVTVNCNNCYDMGNDGLSRLIKGAEQLEHLCLVGCEKISNRLIKDAIRFTKNRKNNVILTMHLSKSNVKLRKITDHSPFLRIVPYV